MKYFPDKRLKRNFQSLWYALLLSMCFLFNLNNAALANIKCIQEELSKTVFDPGPIDGQWGKKTKAAIEDFFAYTGEYKNLGKDVENSNEICGILKSIDKKNSNPSIRTYSVVINDSELKNFLGEVSFDFSGVDVLEDISLSNCKFKIIGIFQDNKRSLKAHGEVSIIGGNLVFGKHIWYSGEGSMANESDLIEEANLVMSKSGELVGSMRYFFMHTGKGETAHPPETISFKPDSKLASRQYTERRRDYYSYDGSQTVTMSLDCDWPNTIANIYDLMENHPIWYDFSSERCDFSLYYMRQENGEVLEQSNISRLASGNLSIANGKILFGRHTWHIGSWIDESYLTTKSNLVILEDGTLAGSMALFSNIDRWLKEKRPPLDIIFDGKIKHRNNQENQLSRDYTFLIDFSWLGQLRLHCLWPGLTITEQPKIVLTTQQAKFLKFKLPSASESIIYSYPSEIPPWLKFSFSDKDKKNKSAGTLVGRVKAVKPGVFNTSIISTDKKGQIFKQQIEIIVEETP